MSFNTRVGSRLTIINEGSDFRLPLSARSPHKWLAQGLLDEQRLLHRSRELLQHAWVRAQFHRSRCQPGSPGQRGFQPCDLRLASDNNPSRKSRTSFDLRRSDHQDSPDKALNPIGTFPDPGRSRPGDGRRFLPMPWLPEPPVVPPRRYAEQPRCRCGPPRRRRCSTWPGMLSSSSTTLEIYADTDEQARREALTKLHDLLGDEN
jgi:hypothetical protein